MNKKNTIKIKKNKPNITAKKIHVKLLNTKRFWCCYSICTVGEESGVGEGVSWRERTASLISPGTRGPPLKT